MWITSALLGQNTFDANEAKIVCELLDLGKDIEETIQIFPLKGTNAIMPPTDPLIYRLDSMKLF